MKTGTPIKSQTGIEERKQTKGVQGSIQKSERRINKTERRINRGKY